ncbi:hypothetical protein AALO_G00179020 [Alosa alosa]|uniref:Uncharacterized protein n=1 Tax=Alosa alosa TaxID=278164 RepID=A0AAV6GD06_9TELE|nr:hypothetical protein AALO_G00179020 [Alosa alosa]
MQMYYAVILCGYEDCYTISTPISIAVPLSKRHTLHLHQDYRVYINHLPIMSYMFKKWTQRRQVNFICNTSESISLRYGSGKNTHTHTHTYIYIYIYIYRLSTVYQR